METPTPALQWNFRTDGLAVTQANGCCKAPYLGLNANAASKFRSRALSYASPKW
jgi:hypothetical protein